MTVHFPDDYPAEEVAGKTAEFDVKVKEVREKELPDLDDDFASEASEFDTLDELRADISEKVRQILDGQIAERFREDALDAPWPRRRSRSRTRSSRPGPRRCGGGSSASCSRRGWTRRTTCRSRARRARR